MQISAFSDYTLRILMFLALSGERQVSSREIADTYGISFDHIAKAAKLLTKEGYVTATRGRGGGMVLSKNPAQISIGEVLRMTESNTPIVECMKSSTPECILSPACGLKHILAGANEAFFKDLDNRSLKDTIPNTAWTMKTLSIAE